MTNDSRDHFGDYNRDAEEREKARAEKEEDEMLMILSFEAEEETKKSVMVQSLLQGIQALVSSTTNDAWAIRRCDEICDALIAFVYHESRTPLPPQGAGAPHRRGDRDRAAGGEG